MTRRFRLFRSVPSHAGTGLVEVEWAGWSRTWFALTADAAIANARAAGVMGQLVAHEIDEGGRLVVGA